MGAVARFILVVVALLVLDARHLSNGANESVVETESLVLSWNGLVATKVELEVLAAWRKTLGMTTSLAPNSWLATRATDLELLRFLRERKGDSVKAWSMITAHNEWRESPLGADLVMRTRREEFASNANLNHEAFWIGESKSGCPTLVIRTQLHDGTDYQDDAKVFSAFIVYMLERGHELFGHHKPFCVWLDRSPAVRVDGTRKVDRLDMGVIPKLVDLFSTMYSTLFANYPDIISSVLVVPSSWFFSGCYRITSQVMEEKMRQKFTMVDKQHLAQRLLSQFDASLLPVYLGGEALDYVPFKETSRQQQQQQEEEGENFGEKTQEQQELVDNVATTVVEVEVVLTAEAAQQVPLSLSPHLATSSEVVHSNTYGDSTTTHRHASFGNTSSKGEEQLQQQQHQQQSQQQSQQQAQQAQQQQQQQQQQPFKFDFTFGRDILETFL